MKNLGILEKAGLALQGSGFDAVLVVGNDHSRYLGGVELPFAPFRRRQNLMLFWQKGSAIKGLCPAEWETTVRETGWIKDIETYAAAGDRLDEAVEKVAGFMQTVKIENPILGMDFERVSSEFYKSLKKQLPGVRFESCDAWLKELRMSKTAAELNLLEQAAYLTDHGINGAIHHVTVDRRTTALTLAEELRVHTIERGVGIVGYHACSHVISGEDSASFWSNPPKFGYSRTNDLQPGDMTRMKIITCLDGYFADAERIMVQGEPTPQQLQAYAMLVRVREAALGSIRPGVRASDVYESICACAMEENISLKSELELGHGIGVCAQEEPYISPVDPTVLKEGMVLVISPVISTQDGGLWCSKDTLVVTGHGCEIMGWYKDWREPYIPIASI
jgi:Xaa-Pro dipeptidase